MRALALSLAVSLLLAAPPAAGQEDLDQVLDAVRQLQEKGEIARALDALRDALDAHPDDARILLELGRTAYMQAMEVLASGTAALGRLALVDATTWLKRAVAAKPDSTEALTLLGEVAVAAGDFETATDAYRRAAELDPGDGESRVQLGYSLAFLRRFPEAIEAFEAAERILGPDPRILLNRGICHASLRETSAAERRFLSLIRGEVRAKRPGSDLARRGFVWLWRIHAKAERYDLAEAAFTALTETFPDLSSSQWYLGHARRERGNAAGAVEAFARVCEISPGWAEGWRVLGETLVSAGKYPEAIEALGKQLELEPAADAGRALLFSIVGGFVGNGEREDALELLEAGRKLFPDDSFVIERRGDLLFATGRPAEAMECYRRAMDLDPFADEIEVKEQKAATALLRKSIAPEMLGTLRREAETREPASSGGTIMDFETSGVFVRVNGAASGRREDGAFALERSGPAGRMANLSLTLIPTLDTRPFTDLRFDVVGPAGRTLLVGAKDCYDQFEVVPAFVRLLHRDPVELTGELKTVTLPLHGFTPVGTRRTIPLNRSRLRSLIFEIGSKLLEEVTLAKEVRIDNLRLVAEDGREVTLVDFDEEPSETLFLSDGAATPFAPTLSSTEQVKSFSPDPNTFISPGIMGRDFDKATVHDGVGSYRLTLTREGTASGALTFNPDRSYDRAVAITFWARGQAGREKVRVTLEDALDLDLENARPASAPRLEVAGTLIEGWFSLGPEWRKYRIPRAAFPDVDFRSLLGIRFHFGTPEGNAEGTTFFLDDIRWE